VSGHRVIGTPFACAKCKGDMMMIVTNETPDGAREGVTHCPKCDGSEPIRRAEECVERDTSLLPCPFCGGTEITFMPERGPFAAAVMCPCGCDLTGDSDDDARARWNQRATGADPEGDQ